MIGNGAQPLVVAEMFVPVASGLEFTFVNGGEYYTIGGLTHGACQGVTIDGSVAHFLIETDGWYKFDGVASLFPSGPMEIVFSVFKNGVVVPKIESSIDFKNSQAMQTFSGNGVLDGLVKGDLITVRGMSDTAGVAVSIRNLNIHLLKIG